MSMKIDGGQPAENKTGFSMEQLKEMSKKKLLSVFDSNNSGSVSDIEITSKGFGDVELQELRSLMDTKEIEKETRETNTGFTVDEFKAMTNEQLLGLFDKNGSGTISEQELKAKGIEDEYIAEIKAKVSSLGIEEKEKAEKTGTVSKDSAVGKNSTTAKTNGTAKPKSAQAAAPKTGAVRKHRFAQVPVGQKPHKVTPPKDIKLPKEANEAMELNYKDQAKINIKVGNFICSKVKCTNDRVRYGDKIRMYATDKKTEYNIYITNNLKYFDYFEYNEKLDNVIFSLTGYLDGSIDSFSTYDYDKWGREVRQIDYNKDGNPIRLKHYTYDANGNQHCEKFEEYQLK